MAGRRKSNRIANRALLCGHEVQNIMREDINGKTSAFFPIIQINFNHRNMALFALVAVKINISFWLINFTIHNFSIHNYSQAHQLVIIHNSKFGATRRGFEFTIHNKKFTIR